MTVEPSEHGSVEIAAVEVRAPSGEQLIDPLEVQLTSGDALVVTGRSGAGKTTLLRSLAQLWPYASGTLRRPDGEHATMFLSQLPYVPLGDLRGVVCYPNSPTDISDAAVRDALTKVALAPLAARLDEERDWAKVLSPGSSSASLLPASCSPSRRRYSSMRRPRRSTRGWNSRFTSCCAPSCRSVSWSASVIGPRSNSTTIICWSCSAKAGGNCDRSSGSRRPSKLRRDLR